VTLPVFILKFCQHRTNSAQDSRPSAKYSDGDRRLGRVNESPSREFRATVVKVGIPGATMPVSETARHRPESRFIFGKKTVQGGSQFLSSPQQLSVNGNSRFRQHDSIPKIRENLTLVVRRSSQNFPSYHWLKSGECQSSKDQAAALIVSVDQQVLRPFSAR